MGKKKTSAYLSDLVKDECINFDHGNCVIENEPCKMMNSDSDQNQNNSVSCEYLLDCAIPANWNEDDLRAYALWRGENSD